MSFMALLSAFFFFSIFVVAIICPFLLLTNVSCFDDCMLADCSSLSDVMYEAGNGFVGGFIV